MQSQNWSYQPVVDADQLRRLRSLYRYALGENVSLIDEYPLIQKTQTLNYINASQSDPLSEPFARLCSRGSTCAVSPTGGTNDPKIGMVVQKSIADEHFLEKPGCVLCLKKENSLYLGKKSLAVNPKLVAMHSQQWIFYREGEVPDARYIGKFGSHEFYIRRDDLPRAFRADAVRAGDDDGFSFVFRRRFGRHRQGWRDPL